MDTSPAQPVQPKVQRAVLDLVVSVEVTFRSLDEAERAIKKIMNQIRLSRIRGSRRDPTELKIVNIVEEK